MKLLIVEANPEMSRLIRSLVEDLPLDVSECGDVATLEVRCVAERPDWLLMDMSCEGALQAARRLATLCPLTGVLLLADEENARLRTAALAAGARGYLLKENLLEVRRLLQL